MEIALAELVIGFASGKPLLSLVYVSSLLNILDRHVTSTVCI